MGFADLFKEVDRSSYTDSDDMPTYPGLSLLTHVNARTIQLGGIVGFIGGLGTSFFVKTPLSSHLIRSLSRGTTFGVVAGTVAVSAMAANGKLDADGLADRAYRLGQNEDQVSLSQQQAISSIIFAGIFAVAFPQAAPLSTRLLAGVSFGSAMSVVSFASLKVINEREKEVGSR